MTICIQSFKSIRKFKLRVRLRQQITSFKDTDSAEYCVKSNSFLGVLKKKEAIRLICFFR